MQAATFIAGDVVVFAVSAAAQTRHLVCERQSNQIFDASCRNHVTLESCFGSLSCLEFHDKVASMFSLFEDTDSSNPSNPCLCRSWKRPNAQ